MLRLVLQRFDQGDQGTFGRIDIFPIGNISANFALYTGELPDRDNAPNLSCVPPRIYRVEWTYSPVFRRWTYQLVDAAPRTGIRAHSANLMGDRLKGYHSQLNGCIALGEKMGWIEGQKALLLSAPAVRRFEMTMDRQPFELEIVNA